MVKKKTRATKFWGSFAWILGANQHKRRRRNSKETVEKKDQAESCLDIFDLFELK